MWPGNVHYLLKLGSKIGMFLPGVIIMMPINLHMCLWSALCSISPMHVCWEKFCDYKYMNGKIVRRYGKLVKG